MTGPRPAAFLDRDGTIIRDADFPNDPDAVELIPGATAALRRLVDAGFALIAVTNQSGIARGKVTVAQYEAVRARLDALLAAEGIALTASYHCPHHPDFTGPCECRKPGSLLYRQAIAEFGLDPVRSLFVGDRWRDVAPGLALGGTAVLVPSPSTPADDRARAAREARLGSTLDDAVSLVLGSPRD